MKYPKSVQSARTTLLLHVIHRNFHKSSLFTNSSARNTYARVRALTHTQHFFHHLFGHNFSDDLKISRFIYICRKWFEQSNSQFSVMLLLNGMRYSCVVVAVVVVVCVFVASKRGHMSSHFNILHQHHLLKTIIIAIITYSKCIQYPRAYSGVERTCICCE